MTVLTAIGTAVGATAAAAASTGAAVVGAAVGVVGLGVSVAGSLAAQGAQDRQIRLERQRQDAQERRRRRQTLRERAIAVGRIQNATSQTGARDSSAQTGGIGSVNAQNGSNLGFISQIGGVNRGVSAAQQDQANASSLGAFGSSLSSVGGTVFNAAGGFDRLL